PKHTTAEKTFEKSPHHPATPPTSHTAAPAPKRNQNTSTARTPPAMYASPTNVQERVIPLPPSAASMPVLRPSGLPGHRARGIGLINALNGISNPRKPYELGKS